MEETGRLLFNVPAQREELHNTKALSWLRMAANAGFPIAQAELGEMHYMANGVDRNLNESRRLLELAAKANYPRVKLDLLQLNADVGQANGHEVQSGLEAMIRSLTPPSNAKK